MLNNPKHCQAISSLAPLLLSRAAPAAALTEALMLIPVSYLAIQTIMALLADDFTG